MKVRLGATAELDRPVIRITVARTDELGIARSVSPQTGPSERQPRAEQLFLAVRIDERDLLDLGRAARQREVVQASLFGWEVGQPPRWARGQQPAADAIDELGDPQRRSRGLRALDAKQALLR